MTRNLNKTIAATSRKLDRAIMDGNRQNVIILSWQYDSLMKLLQLKLKVQ